MPQDKWQHNVENNLMAKKKKNIRHTQAIHRKENAITEMAKLGLDLKDDIAVVGFVFNHLAISHMTYLGLTSINKLCKTYAGIDICLFSQHIIQPCVQLLCPSFTMSDLMRWHQYPLITTSIGTTIEALSSNTPIIYHYAFDPEFIDKQHIDSSDLITAFCDPRVRVIIRHEDHRKLIEEEFNINVCDTVIPDCDAELLVKLTLTEMKNDR